MRSRALVGGLVAAALAAACGTTVPQSSQGPANAVAGGLSNPPLDAPQAAPQGVATGGPGGGPGAAIGGSGGAATAGPAQPVAGDTGGGAAGGTTGARHTSPVTVGWVVLKSNAAVAGSLGFSSVATPDQTPYAQAMVDWVNGHGGLGGRQLKPVFFHMDASGTQTIDQYGAQACAFFTQDNHVDVVVDPSIGGTGAQLVDCLDRKKVPHVDTTGMLDTDGARLSRLATFLPAASVAIDTLAGLHVSALADFGFYGGGSTVGLVTYDQPVMHTTVERVLKPRLAGRTGTTLKDQNIAYLPAYSSTADTAAISAAVSNAVLKFNTQGVNRVIFLQSFSLATVLFMREADNQRYYPRYGLSSNDSPQTLVGLAPTSQLANAIGFGWRPVYDVTSAQQLQPGRPACLAVFKGKGLTFAAADASEAAALRHCEGALLLKAGADASGGGLGADLVTAIKTQLGSYRAATVLGIRLTPQHADGVSVFRDLAYVTSCGCFRYTRGPRPVR